MNLKIINEFLSENIKFRNCETIVAIKGSYFLEFNDLHKLYLNELDDVIRKKLKEWN